MEKQKILITGGAGGIGSVFVNSLKDSYQIDVVDNLHNGFRENISNKNINFIEADISNPDTYSLLGNYYDCVFHLAAVSSLPFCENNKDVAFRYNFLGTSLLIEYCRINGIKNFIFASTSAVYENNSADIFTEDLNVNPDLAVFGKTIANGVAMGAIIGKKKIMKNATKTFISSVFWTEKIGPACAVAFIKKYERLELEKILIKKGKKIKSIWSEAARYSNLDIKISGIDPLATFKLNVKNWPACITYFIQEMLKKNILASDKCYANYMHSDKYIQKYKEASFEVFYEIAKLNKMNNLEKKLEGPVKQIDFSRLTDEK